MKKFSDYDPDEPLNHYDDDPYRPLHPMREGFTMLIAAIVVVGIILWLLYKVV